MNLQSVKKLFVANRALKRLSRPSSLAELSILYAISYSKGITASKLYHLLSRVSKTKRKGVICSILKKLCAEGLVKREVFQYQKGHFFYIDVKGIVALNEFEKALRIVRLDRL